DRRTATFRLQRRRQRARAVVLAEVNAHPSGLAADQRHRVRHILDGLYDLNPLQRDVIEVRRRRGRASCEQLCLIEVNLLLSSLYGLPDAADLTWRASARLVIAIVKRTLFVRLGLTY